MKKPATGLCSLLSQVLVAFIIEFDNEFERRAPHHTTRFGPNKKDRTLPYLVSMVMWQSFLRFVPREGTTLRDLYHRCGLPKPQFRFFAARLGKRWGYLKIDPRPPAKASRATWPERRVVPTPAGLKALDTWAPLEKIIEERWDKRFGKELTVRLRQSLRELVNSFPHDLPSFLPILGFHLLNAVPEERIQRREAEPNDRLVTLLSKGLLAFAFEFEGELQFSLAICANVLRLCDARDVRMPDIPRLSGVSKEAASWAIKRLLDGNFVEVQKKAGTRWKYLVLTKSGKLLRGRYRRLEADMERRWRHRYGDELIANLKTTLGHLVHAEPPDQAPIMLCLRTTPENWRSELPQSETLPHFPMILHRGGFPDGS